MFNRIMFLGSKKSGLKVLKELCQQVPEKLVLCLTIDDTKDIRSELKEFQNFCSENRITIEIMSGKCDISAYVEQYQPDLCIVMGWYYIISREVLDKVRGGFIGIHNSLLPKYRGFAPVVWSMINGEKATGFSVFSFSDGMDTGKIWYQKEVPIYQTDYIEDVLDRIDEEIGRFFKKDLNRIINESLSPYEQSNTVPTYGAKRMPTDGRIDWTKNSTELYNFVRAQSKPYPGAYTFLSDKKIIIWRVEMFQYPLFGIPGRVALIDQKEQSAVVACGDNTGIKLKTVEVDNETGSPLILKPTLSTQFL